MKVNIYETVEVTDAERYAMGAFFDGPDAKRRQATRDEMKEFIWIYGKGWKAALTGEPQGQDAVDDPDGTFVDDIIGSTEEDLSDLI